MGALGVALEEALGGSRRCIDSGKVQGVALGGDRQRQIPEKGSCSPHWLCRKDRWALWIALEAALGGVWEGYRQRQGRKMGVVALIGSLKTNMRSGSGSSFGGGSGRRLGGV